MGGDVIRQHQLVYIQTVSLIGVRDVVDMFLCLLGLDLTCRRSPVGRSGPVGRGVGQKAVRLWPEVFLLKGELTGRTKLNSIYWIRIVEGAYVEEIES